MRRFMLICRRLQRPLRRGHGRGEVREDPGKNRNGELYLLRDEISSHGIVLEHANFMLRLNSKNPIVAARGQKHFCASSSRHLIPASTHTRVSLDWVSINMLAGYTCPASFLPALHFLLYSSRLLENSINDPPLEWDMNSLKTSILGQANP